MNVMEFLIGWVIGIAIAVPLIWLEAYEQSMQAWFGRHGPEYRRVAEELEQKAWRYRLTYRRLTLRGRR
jgi:hypothetical protein